MLAGIQNKIECSFCYWMVPVCNLWHAMLMALSCLSLSQSKFQPNEMRAHPESWIRRETVVAYFIYLLNLLCGKWASALPEREGAALRRTGWCANILETFQVNVCMHHVDEMMRMSLSVRAVSACFILCWQTQTCSVKGTACTAELMQTRKFSCWLRALNNAWLTNVHSFSFAGLRLGLTFRSSMIE